MLMNGATQQMLVSSDSLILRTAKAQPNADEKLKQVFGGKRQVSMFEMTKLVSNHLK